MLSFYPKWTNASKSSFSEKGEFCPTPNPAGGGEQEKGNDFNSQCGAKSLQEIIFLPLPDAIAQHPIRKHRKGAGEMGFCRRRCKCIFKFRCDRPGSIWVYRRSAPPIYH